MKKVLAGLTAVLGFAVFLPTNPAGADGTETLGPPSIPIAQGSDVASAGTGMFVQPATVSVAVPGSVEQVLLYWEGLTEDPNGVPDNTIVVDPAGPQPAVEVTGQVIGGPTLFFFSASGAPVRTTSFRADVTDLNLVASGSTTTLELSGLDFNFANDGASVVVIYDDGTTGVIQVRDGNDAAFGGFEPPLDTTVPQTFTFPSAPTARTADLHLAVGSVEENRPNQIRITVDGDVTTLEDPLGDDEGKEWDNFVIPVNIPAGATTLTVEVLAEDDGTGRLPASLVWVNAILSIAGAPPVCTPSSTPAVTHGMAYGVDVNILGLQPIDKLGKVSSVAPGSPDSDAKHLLAASVPGLVSAKVLGTTSNSSLDPSKSTATSTVADINLLNGLVRATTIRAVSQSVATPNGTTRSSDGSNIQGLTVNGKGVNVAPNTKVAVKLLGITVADLRIYEETGSSTFANGVSKSSHSVNMLHLTVLNSLVGFPAGTEVIVAHAETDAQSPTSGCPDARSVSGEAFTAFVDGNLGGKDFVDVKVGDAVLPSTGGANSDGTVVNLPGIVTSVTAGNTTSGSLNPHPHATSRSVVEGANVLGGLVTARVLDVKSSSAADGTNASTAHTATFADLKVAGVSVAANVAPNTSYFIDLGAAGFVHVVLNERFTAGNGTSDTEGTINAVHARVYTLGGLLTGEVIVASAHSDAHT